MSGWASIMRRMRTSKTGLELIKSFEGYRARAAQLPDGVWTIGYSHTQSARENLRITMADADAVLREYDLPPIENMLGASVLAPLNQNQFDALVSFTFNIGVDAFQKSLVLAKLNSGASLAAADAMMTWRKARLNGQVTVVDALVRRRAMEQALFLKHPNGAPVAPSGFVRPIGEDMAAPANGSVVEHRNAGTSATPSRRATPMVPASVGIVHETVSNPPPEHAGPTPDEITRAISALANPENVTSLQDELPPVRLDEPAGETSLTTAENLPPPPMLDEHIFEAEQQLSPAAAQPNGKTFIDDLEPVEIDPLLLQQVAENSKTEGVTQIAGQQGTILHTLLGLVGIGIAGFAGQRLVDSDEALIGPGQTADVEKYLNVGGIVLGGFLVLIAFIFMMRRRD